ncbi:MAG: hypothetical protein OQK09_01380 [Colwellia sp.]|nr:hypothetical protein [Colwellia sp.]MCW8865671.1 hypothetical protein [Colwellia sp.]MCW9080141.1 hypothetical protein [Colwellia sp.]
MISDDDFLDDIDAEQNEIEQVIDIEANELAEKEAQLQAQKNLLARKRIDELKEKKRLKDLLDDENDW